MIVQAMTLDTPINSSLIKKKLVGNQKTNILDGLKKTIYWYFKNIDWCNKILESSGYKGERLGTKNNIY